MIQWNRLELNLIGYDYITDGLLKQIKDKGIYAVVVSKPDAIRCLQRHRMTTGSRYKIITAVGFDDTNQYSISKFRNMDRVIMESDGFDILLSNTPNNMSIRNEVDTIYRFVKEYNKLYELRFTIGAFSRNWQFIDNVLLFIKKNPPTMVRIDHDMNANVNIESMKKIVERIKLSTHYPLKLIGNISPNTMSIFNKEIGKFDISIDTFNKLIDLERKSYKSSFSDPIEDGDMKLNCSLMNTMQPNT